MDPLFRIDWHKLFVPQFSVLEIVVRGAITYLALCLLLRLVMKRQTGKVALSDLLVVTLVAGVCRNPLVADVYSITDGMGVVAVVLLCNFALDWLSYYSPYAHKLLHPERVSLVRDGTILHENLRRELMTETQLRSKLRQQGVIDPAEVAEARMEGDGHISVVKKTFPGQNSTTPANGSGRATGAERNGHPLHDRISSAAHSPGDDPQTVNPEEPDLQLFLQAAQKVQDRMRWHEEQMAEHAARVAELKGALASWGFHVKPSLRRRGKGSTQGNEAQPARD